MNRILADPADRCGWPQVLLFDLDGTLIDSAPDIAAAVNEVLALEKLGPLSVDQVRSMIGNGVRKLVERAFAACAKPLGEAELDARHAAMGTIYAKHLTNLTTLMPGAEDMLRAYHKARVNIAVVTNKPEGLTRQIIEHFGWSDLVDVVVGGDTCETRKPDPGMLFHALDKVGLPANRALMVGDSPADIDAARAANIASIAVRGGYTTVAVEHLGADLVIDSLAELPAAIERLKQPA